MALHEAPPRRSHHREAIRADLSSRQTMANAAPTAQLSRGTMTLQFPRQGCSSTQTAVRLDPPSSSNTSYRRSPVGSSISLCAPVVGELSPSSISSTHRFDMKRMLSKPASSARPSSPDPPMVQPKVAPNPASSPYPLRSNASNNSASSRSYSFSNPSPPTGSGPIPSPHHEHSTPPLPVGRTRRTLSFSESDGPQAEEGKRPVSGQFPPSSDHHCNPPILASPSQRLNARGGTPSPPIEPQVQHPFPTMRSDDLVRRGFLSSISPQSNSATGIAHQCTHMAETHESPSPSYLPPPRPTIHAPSMNSDLSSYPMRTPRKEAPTPPSPLPTPSSNGRSLPPKSPLANEHQCAQRDRDAYDRVLAQMGRTQLSDITLPSRIEPGTPKIDPYAVVDYIPAGPREYAPTAASATAAGTSSHRSPCLEPPSPTSDHHRDITSGGTNVVSTPSAPTSVPLETSSSSGHGSRGTAVLSTNSSSKWQVPGEWRQAHTTPIAAELNISTPTVASQGSTTGSTTTSAEEDGHPHRTLTRKVSRKLLKRPRRLDLADSGAAAAGVPVSGSGPDSGAGKDDDEPPVPSAQSLQQQGSVASTSADEGIHRSGGSRLLRLMKKLSTSSMRESYSSSGTRSPKWTPSDPTDVPPVPPLPASASLSASLNSPGGRTRENRSFHFRRTSSSTDLGVLLSSSSHVPLLSGGAAGGAGFGPSGSPNSKGVTSSGGYLSRVLRRRGSTSQVSNASRHDTKSATPASRQRGAAWSRRSTSSSRAEEEHSPCPVPPVPEISQHNSSVVATGDNLVTKAKQPPLQQQHPSPPPPAGPSPRTMSQALDSNSDFEADPISVLNIYDDLNSAASIGSGKSAGGDGGRAAGPTRVAGWESPSREHHRNQPPSTTAFHASSFSMSMSMSAPPVSQAPLPLPSPAPAPKSSTSLRQRLSSFSSHKGPKEKEGLKDKGTKNTAKSRDKVGTSSHPGYSTTGRSSRKSKEKRWSLDPSGGAGGQQAVALASFAEVGLDSTPKKTALEKDRMWDELMKRSDRAPGGTLHASIEGGLALASDDLDGNVL